MQRKHILWLCNKNWAAKCTVQHICEWVFHYQCTEAASISKLAFQFLLVCYKVLEAWLIVIAVIIIGHTPILCIFNLSASSWLKKTKNNVKPVFKVYGFPTTTAAPTLQYLSGENVGTQRTIQGGDSVSKLT